MHIQCRQTLLRRYQTFSVLSNNETSVGCIEMQGTFIVGKGKFSLEYQGNHTEFVPIFAEKKLPIMVYGMLPMTYDIVQNGICTGRICEETRRGKFLLPYTVDLITFGNETYEVYEIGMGKEGTNYCIYHQGEQIALIERPSVIHDNLLVHDIFAKNQMDIAIGVLYTAFLMMRAYTPGRPIMTKSVSAKYIVTKNKALQEKYDPNFRELCI